MNYTILAGTVLAGIGAMSVDLNADIIALDKNPMEDVSALKDVSFVMKRGTIYKQNGCEC